MSERYMPDMEKNSSFGQERYHKPDMSSVFGDLPVSEGVDLNILSCLVPEGIEPTLLKKQVETRYSNLERIRLEAGFDKLEVGGDVAIALLDLGTYGELLERVQSEVKTLTVARHEKGHEYVASNLHWHVNSITVVPGNDYLGLTESIPPEGISFSDWLLESAAISFGGKIAAMMSGDEVRGIGADMASVAAKARIAVSMPDSRFSSEQAFIREAENIATSAVNSVGASALNREALILLEKQTVAA